MMNGIYLKGDARGLIDLYPGHLPEPTYEKQENFSHDSRCPCWDSNYAPPKQKSLDEPVLKTHVFISYCFKFCNCYYLHKRRCYELKENFPNALSVAKLNIKQFPFSKGVCMQYINIYDIYFTPSSLNFRCFEVFYWLLRFSDLFVSIQK